MSERAQDSTESEIIQRNRLLAKAKFKEQVKSSSIEDLYGDDGGSKESSYLINRNGKRVQTTAAAGAASSSSSLKPLPNLIGKFVDYDLSTMKNSQGGFLLDNEEDDPKILKQRQQVAELKRQRTLQAQKFSKDPCLSLDQTKNPRCKICSSVELDFQIYQIFKVPVCFKCKNENPDRFSLLTKTECKEDYLLTDPELKDTELLPHLLKPNPHRSTYSNMMLYLREQVESYVFSEKKWGSPEALDDEFRRREEEKKVKKNKKFEEKLKSLRKNTRTNVWHKRVERDSHLHVFEEVSEDEEEDDIGSSSKTGGRKKRSKKNSQTGSNSKQNDDDGFGGSSKRKVQRCKTCGLKTEFETF